MSPQKATDREFTELVSREYRSATAASAMIVGDAAVAEEIVQDVLERTYERWQKVSRLDKPGAWIRRAVINQSISATRRRKSERRALGRLMNRSAASTRHRGLDGEAPVGPTSDESASPSFEIWSAVSCLPASQATAVALHYGADLAIDTVAEEMDLSSSAVKSLLHRARGELRQHHIFKEVAQ